MRYAVPITTVLVLLCSLATTTKSNDDYYSPYARWSNGPPTDPAFFPIGVWLQDPENAPAYKKAGINMYVGLWQGPTERQLETLKTSGMRVICDQNDVGLRHIDDPTIIAWMQVDEPDNAQRQLGGFWNEVPPEVIVERYGRMRQKDASRPVWLNLGQGVANDEWRGRAADFSDYPRYLQGADILSFDVYPVAGIDKPDGENYLWYVARGIDRLRNWSKDSKPVWNFIETTRIQSDRGPTPKQVEAEVWLSLVHGSRGLVYFAHEWTPRFNEARLLEDREMLEAVTRINAGIHELAPILNSRHEIELRVSSTVLDVPVHVLAKLHSTDIYVFAVPAKSGSTGAFFHLPDLEGRQLAEVVGENRSIEVVDGKFEDSFDSYEVHIYRISFPPAE